jgi:hypothetical protein
VQLCKTPAASIPRHRSYYLASRFDSSFLKCSNEHLPNRCSPSASRSVRDLEFCTQARRCLGGPEELLPVAWMLLSILLSLTETLHVSGCAARASCPGWSSDGTVQRSARFLWSSRVDWFAFADDSMAPKLSVSCRCRQLVRRLGRSPSSYGTLGWTAT